MFNVSTLHYTDLESWCDYIISLSVTKTSGFLSPVSILVEIYLDYLTSTLDVLREIGDCLRGFWEGNDILGKLLP